MHIDWEHGNDVLKKSEVLGYVDWKTMTMDDTGIWVERVLNRRNKYVKMLENLIRKGLIGNSTEPIQDGVMKSVDGEILKWPLYRDTLTVSPMEYRMLDFNSLQELKAVQKEMEDDGLTDTLFYKSLIKNDFESLELELELLKIILNED